MRYPLSIALIVIGVVLLLFGLGSADSIRDGFSRLFTGSPTDRTLWLMVGGTVCFLVGAVGIYRGARN